MRRHALLITLVPAVLLAVASSRADTLDYAAIAQVQSSDYVRRQLAQIETHAAAQQVAPLVALGTQVLNDPSIAAPAREFVLSKTAIALGALPSSAAAATLLDVLARHTAQTWLERAHDDGSHASRVPAFDVGAAARFALEQHAVGAQADALAARLKDPTLATRWPVSGNPQVTNSLQSKANDTMPGTVATKAAQSLTADQMINALPALLSALPGSPQLAGAAIHAAVTLRDPAPLLAVINHGTNRDALAALRASRALGSSALELRVVNAAIARADTAAAALSQLAHHVAQNPADTPQLLAWLEQSATALPAARALAKLERADIAVALGERLHATDDRATATALALSLSLMRNEAAREQLDRYLTSDRGLPALQRKLRAARQGVNP